MTDNTRAVIGDNQPPTPMEVCASQHDDVISEAVNWTDGEPVADQAAMMAVDELIKGIKSYRSALVKAGKEHTTPPHLAWKAAVADVSKYTDDADRIQSALVACVAPFKAKAVDEQRQKEREAWEARDKLRREAEELAAKASASNLDDQRAADAARQAAMDADKVAKATAKDKVKGMRTVTRYEIEDHRAALNWIAKNDRDAVTAFIEEHVRKNHKTQDIAGVRVWQEKEAF